MILIQIARSFAEGSYDVRVIGESAWRTVSQNVTMPEAERSAESWRQVLNVPIEVQP